MNPNQAVDAVRSMLRVRAAEHQRLEMLAQVARPSTPWRPTPVGANALPMENITQVPVPEDAQPSMVRMAQRSETNFLPLVLDTFSQVMKVDNYLSGENDGSKGAAWQWWQRNQMDARQTGLHRSTLHYGVAYNTVLPSLTPGEADGGVYMYPASPRQMTAIYGERLLWDPNHGGPVDDDWPMMALEINGPMIRLYDEKSVYFVGVKNQPHSTLGWKDPTYNSINNFEYIESRDHGVGVTPIVRYRDRVLLDGEEQFGIIEPLLTVQSRINETTFGMLVAQYVAAFKQRYIAGWLPESETDALKMRVNNVWTFKEADVKVGSLDETDLTRYIDSKKSAVMDLSAMAQLPPHALGMDGISNISEETLAALETAKERKTDEITTSIGESHEQALRLAAYISGDEQGAQDFASEVKWRDSTARAFAATVDALGKLGQMLGVPDEILWESIPGWTREQVERAKAMRQTADPLEQFYMQAAQGSPRDVTAAPRATSASDPTTNVL